MQFKSKLLQNRFSHSLELYVKTKWELLPSNQKKIIQKFWSILTFKWRWQLVMNIPYLLIFLLDRTVPSVHQFDINLLASIKSKIPIEQFMAAISAFN